MKDPIDRLAQLSPRTRLAFLRRHPELRAAAVVDELYARVVRLARVDARRTARLAAAGRARRIFERHGIALGLARLDSNVGNILSRQDRFEDALASYQRAYAQLSIHGEPQDVAAVLINLALCYINLHDFDKAL